MFKNEETYEPSFCGFQSFLETKDPNESYKWMDGGNCACAQYSHTMGMRDNQWVEKIKHNSVWKDLNEIARGYQEDARIGPSEWTFGKCLQRVKEYDTV